MNNNHLTGVLSLDHLHVSASLIHILQRVAQLIDMGRVGVARPLLAAAHALTVPSAELELLEARLAAAEGRWDLALLTLNEAIDRVPSHAGLRKFRACVLHQTGDPEGAALDAAEAIVLDPSNPDAKGLLGTMMLDLGRTAEAISCLAESLRMSPANTDHREKLAVALQRAGELDAALQVLLDGISLCPPSVRLLNAAILLCVQRRDCGQAVRLAEKARSIGIANACTLGMKGHALASLGCEQEAATAYREALSLAPEDQYLSHLVVAAGNMADSHRTPPGHISAAFDKYADRFESHLITLGYSLPSAIRSLLSAEPSPVGPILDLGCGTGMVASALEGLPIGPITGIDLSERMLHHARAKGLYAELRQGDIVTELAIHRRMWPIIIAADVLCYFGALNEILTLVCKRIQPGGRFFFSVEEIRPNHDGTAPGNGQWALLRQGRYAHSEGYVNDTIRATNWRVVHREHIIVRHEAGGLVPGQLFVVQRNTCG